jgi:predicted NBD/HSP70 family sugar kinase
LAGGDPTEVTAATLFAAASAGDAAAATLISDEAKLLAHAIATVALVLAPSVVIIGGGLSRAGALLLDPIQERLPALLPVPPPQVLQSTLGEDAATIGAIYVALQITDDRLYTTVAGGER